MKIPVHNASGDPAGEVELDDRFCGGVVRPDLLKQACVRVHANQRQGTVGTKRRADVAHSSRKLYRQKGTGNARRGDINANLLRGGGHAKAKEPHSWRQAMPRRMRRLANRNALLAKAVDGQIKLVEGLTLDRPATGRCRQLLQSLGVDRTAVLALEQTRGAVGLSGRNLEGITVTQIDRINAYDLLTHRDLVADRADFEGYLDRLRQRAGFSGSVVQEVG